MDPVYGWILRLALAGLFALAAFHKARDPEAFGETLRAYRILPERAARRLAPIVCVAEAAVASTLVVPAWSRIGAGGAALLLAAYSIAIAANLVRGRRDIDCGCLGPGQRQLLSGWLLVRNALLFAGAALVLLPVTIRSLHWLDGVTLLFGLAALPLLFMALNQLAARAPDLERMRGPA